jgi:uncharacterized protein YerC
MEAVIAYCDEKDIEIELALTEITVHYLRKQRDYEKCKKYGSEGIKIGNVDVIGLLAYNEYDEDNFDELIEYFILLSEKCDESTFINPEWKISKLVTCYLNFLDMNENYVEKLQPVKKILSIIKSNEHRKSLLTDIYFNLDDFRNYIEIYQIFKEICDINEIPKEIVNDSGVVKYINKCNLMYKICDECCVCLNNNIKSIPLECCHYFCTNCYPKILETGSCPNCRCEV